VGIEETDLIDSPNLPAMRVLRDLFEIARELRDAAGQLVLTRDPETFAMTTPPNDVIARLVAAIVEGTWMELAVFQNDAFHPDVLLLLECLEDARRRLATIDCPHVEVLDSPEGRKGAAALDALINDVVERFRIQAKSEPSVSQRTRREGAANRRSAILCALAMNALRNSEKIVLAHVELGYQPCAARASWSRTCATKGDRLVAADAQRFIRDAMDLTEDAFGGAFVEAYFSPGVGYRLCAIVILDARRYANEMIAGQALGQLWVKKSVKGAGVYCNRCGRDIEAQVTLASTFKRGQQQALDRALVAIMQEMLGHADLAYLGEVGRPVEWFAGPRSLPHVTGARECTTMH
jgi:hypothetical protein